MKPRLTGSPRLRTVCIDCADARASEQTLALTPELSVPVDDDLGRTLGELCHLHGTFTLRSGVVASTYFDKYLFESEPSVLRAVATRLAVLVPAGTEILAGLELGGVPIATALSLTTGLPAVFVRKVAKPYGTAKLAEGTGVTGRHVLVIEDVITTGGQIAKSTKDLRRGGALVEYVLCVIDRSAGDHSVLQAAGVEVLSLFAADELV